MDKGSDKKRSQTRRQPKKDSKTKRVNFDNTRETKFDKDVKQEGYKMSDKCNDVRWYAYNPEMLKSAASLPFSQTTGLNLGFKGKDFVTVPGVCSLSWIPVLGCEDMSPINVAAEQVYSYVVHANSRNTSYNAEDLMMVIIAGTQVFSALASAVRAYGVMRTFDQRNYYLPKALIRAMGFNYEDLQANLATMWFDINEMIARSSQIWIPNTMTVLDRWFWLNSNVYMDSASIKGQFYVFTQNHFLGFNATEFNTGSALTWMRNDGTCTGDSIYENSPDPQHTWHDFKVMINGMMDLLLSNEDRGTMMGDILKAYGTDRLYAMKPISSDYTVVPVYDQEVLTQIENATIYNSYPYGYRQFNGRIVRTGQTTSIVPLLRPCGQSILNFHFKEVPTPEQIMVATRLITLGLVGSTVEENNQATLRPYTQGTEQVQNVCYWQYISGSNFYTTRTDGSVFVRGQESDLLIEGLLQNELVFDWSPWYYEATAQTIPETPVAGVDYSNLITSAFGDYDNYTVLDMRELEKMNRTALYSQFGVPVL